MKYDFRKVTNKDVEDILTWKYEGIYSFYNSDKTQGKIDWIQGLPEDDKAVSVYNDENELIGHCEIDTEEEITLSVQMRPDLTGKGMGKEFVQCFLDFAKEKYNLKSIGLLVAKFNERAIKLYKNIGFQIIEEFTSQCNGEETEFIVMEKQL